MASIKLSAIIEDISGSIGNLVFRRSGNNHLVQFKPVFFSKSNIIAKSGLIFMRSVIRLYSALAIADKDSWNAEAPKFLFPDRYGIMRALTGRQLFIKLVSKTNQITAILPDPLLLVQDVLDTRLVYYNVTFNNHLYTYFESLLKDTYVFLAFQVTKPDVYHVKFVGQKVLLRFNLNDETDFMTGNFLSVNFPLASAGDKLWCFYYTVNEHGFTSPVQSLVTYI